jgi:hypothetical protein
MVHRNLRGVIQRQPRQGEALAGNEEMFMANRQATEFTERVVGSLDDPAASVAAPLSLAASIGRDQLDAAFVQTLPQRVRIIGSGGNPSFRPLPGRAFGARDADFDACPFRKTTVSLSGSLWPNSQPKTLAIYKYKPTRTPAALFSGRNAPFLARAQPPMMHSPHFSSFCRHFTAEVQQQTRLRHKSLIQDRTGA